MLKKIKVKNALFVYLAMSHVFLSIYYYNIHITVYESLLSIQICLMQINTTNS